MFLAERQNSPLGRKAHTSQPERRKVRAERLDFSLCALIYVGKGSDWRWCAVESSCAFEPFSFCPKGHSSCEKCWVTRREHTAMPPGCGSSPALPLVPHTTDYTILQGCIVSLQEVAAGCAPIIMLHTVLLFVREIHASHEHIERDNQAPGAPVPGCTSTSRYHIIPGTETLVYDLSYKQSNYDPTCRGVQGNYFVIWCQSLSAAIRA